MRYLSVCSGIEAASCAWHPLGWTPVAFSEIEAFPSAVLAHHYPGVPNWGDMTKFKEWPDAAVDVLVGGTPCQSFSVAGLRKGLADPRGNLALTYLALADRYRPEWLVWENVPGVLSADGGEAFGAFLGGLGELGYGWAYRVLDAQYFGLAQRRKRVFVIASLRGWHRAAAVLFDAASLRGDSAPRRAPGQSPAASLRTRAPGSGGQGTDWEHTVTGTLGARMGGGGGFGTDFEAAGGLQPVLAHTLMARAGSALTAPGYQTFIPTMLGPVAPRLDASMDRKWGSNQWVDSGQFVLCASDGQANAAFSRDMATSLTATHEAPCIAHTLSASHGCTEDGTGRGTRLVAQTLTSGGTGERGYIDPVNTTLVAFDTTQMTSVANRSNPKAGDPCHPLASGAHPPAVAFDARQSDVIQYGEKTGPLDTDGHSVATLTEMQVRRLTPRECERLQGFHDDYTLTPYRGKPAADGPRYKALGNSMAVPVMHWIGKRIKQVQDIGKEPA